MGSICKEPLTPAASGDFWDGEQPNFFNLVGHAFNRKRDVQKQIEPIRNCLDDLDQAASSQTSAIKDVNSRTQQGLQLASSKTIEADAHTTEATNRANAALQTADPTSSRISSAEHLVGNLREYQGGTPTEIHFSPGQSVLSKSAKDALDQLAASVKRRHNYVLEVRGYSPGQGQAAIENSRRIADSVVRYLVFNYPIPPHRILSSAWATRTPCWRSPQNISAPRGLKSACSPTTPWRRHNAELIGQRCCGPALNSSRSGRQGQVCG